MKEKLPMKILISVPNLSRPGGVAALFNILQMEVYNPNISLFCIHNQLWSIFRIPLKYINFIFKLRSVDVVHLNPSLTRKSFFRDAVFAWLTLLFSKKLIIYWHGWEESYEQKIKENKFLSWVIKHSFLNANTTIVLGKLFESKLREMGYKNRIVIETNCAENKYIRKQQVKNIPIAEPIRLLYLSRLEIAKGVYLAIDTLRILNRKGNRFKLIIAGTGSEEENIKELIKGDETIEFAGYVNAEAKHKQLLSAHLMFFPSSHPEGMPLTLLEGMMYGLPVVSRPVGGIPDIVMNEKNGYLLESLEPSDFANKIDQIVNNFEFYQKMSKNNIIKSKLFSPEIVRERLNSIYESV